MHGQGPARVRAGLEEGGAAEAGGGSGELGAAVLFF